MGIIKFILTVSFGLAMGQLASWFIAPWMSEFLDTNIQHTSFIITVSISLLTMLVILFLTREKQLLDEKTNR